MKKQINPTIKAYLIRGAFYLLLLLAVCAIPFALAQRQATKRAVADPSVNIKIQNAPPSTGAVGVSSAQQVQGGLFPLQQGGAVSAQQQKQPFEGGNPAALSNADLPRGMVQPRPFVPFAYAEKAPYPFSGGVDRHATATFNNFLYVMGGEFFNGSTFAITDKLQRFDPVGNAWVELAPMPSVYDNNEACAMNGKIYVPGGYAGSGPPFSAIHYIYDIATNAWTTGAAVPAPATLWAVVACDAAANKVYVIGGFDGVGPTTGTKIYDATANTWSSGAALPDPRYGADGALIAGNIYVAGGANATGNAQTSMYRYTVATNTWSAPLAPMAVGCLYGAVGVDTSNRLYIAGGGFCTNAANPTGRTERYDPATNSWATIDTLNEAVRHTNGGVAGAGNTLFNVSCGFGAGPSGGIYPNTQQLVVGGGGTPTPTPTPTGAPCNDYTFTSGTGTIVPGVTDTGNHGDDVSTVIPLPFPVTIYGTSYTSAAVGSNGHLTFGTVSNAFTLSCMPVATATDAMGPYWRDQRTDAVGGCTGCGIFTTTTGTAPNRIFRVEYRTIYFGQTSATPTLNYEVNLYESGTPVFEYVYGLVTPFTATGRFLTVGVQHDATRFTEFACDPTGGTNPPVATGQKLTASCAGGVSPTPTATATPTAMVSATPTATCTPSGGKIYNIAGFNLGGQSTATRIYDIATNSWTTGAPIPEAAGLADHATAYWNGKIYVAGGYNGAAINTLRIYDIATNSWTTGAPLPQALYLPGFGAINGKVYVAGGNNGASDLNTLYIYDIATNAWTTGPVVPTAVTAPGSTVYQGKLYLFGGAAPFPTTTTITQIYDPVANSWSSGPSMNVPRLWFYGGAIDNTSIVAPGGDTTPGIPISANEQLTATWAIKAPLPFAARGPFAVSDGTFVYIGGGYDGTNVHADLLRYDPVANSYTPLAPSADGHFLSQAVIVPGGACGTPTATPTVTPTATPTATQTGTPSPTPTCVPGGGQITTLFASNNNGSPGGANYFDLTVAANPISVTALDINTNSTAQFSNLRVYTKLGTFAGNETNMALWTQVATGSGTGAGQDLPTHVTLSNPIPLLAGTLYGIAVVADPTISLFYTNGTGSNQNYSNADLALFLGSATNVPFTAPVFSPRVWNGTIYYSSGGGCASPTPTATGTPSATPTCPPGGSPGPWTQAAPVAVDHYGGFMDSDGTVAYEGGGYSFTTSGTINQFGKFNPATNTWTPLAPVPDLFNAEASAVYAPNVNKLFVFGGDDPTTGTVVNTTRIYDIATNTWSTGAPMPDVRAFMGSGYFNGKIYLVGGYSTGNVDPAFAQVWEYDPVANTFNTSRMDMPAALGGAGSGIINGHLYIAGGRTLANTNLNTLYDYDIAANTWSTRANLPAGTNVPGSAVIGGKLWIFGGGNPFTGAGTSPTSARRGLGAWLKRVFSPDTTGALQVYDPATDSWTSGPSLNQIRSFPAGTDVGNTAVAVGGYTGSTTTASVEINVVGGGCASPTPTVPPSATPTASPSCTPGGSPGPWSTASPYPIPDVRYGFAQTATHFYVFGGVSDGTRVNNVNRLDLATGMWESRAAMPFTSEAPTCALMASTGIVYCTEGDTGSGFASYNIATNTWSSLASIPGGDHYGSASGAFNGKVFVAGGTTGFVSTVQVYDVATNTWSAGTAAPNDFLLAGYQQVGQFLYVVGGFEASGPVKPSAAQSSVLNRGMQSQQPKVPMANNTTTWRLDMSSAPGVWTTGPAFTAGRADFGLAYDAGTNKLYALGGDLPGGGFFDSTNAVDELSVASWPAGSWVASPPNLILPNRQANQAGFYGSGQIWSVGGLVGQTFQFLAEVQRRTNGGAPCGSPTATPTFTPTATATATATFTPTATATATFTPTATATATFTPTATATISASPTATASPTVPPRPTPSPRPRPTPPPHVANCYNNDNCTGFPKSSQLTCADCLMSGGSSWVDSSGCHTTCP